MALSVAEMYKYIQDYVDKRLHNAEQKMGELFDKYRVKVVADNIDMINHVGKLYIGAYDNPPIKRHDGEDIEIGDIYFDLSIKKVKVFDGDGWNIIPSAIDGIYKPFTFTGDGVTKSFEIITGYNAPYGFVFVDGLNVTPKVDLSDGKNIIFDEAPHDGAIINGALFGSFEIGDCIRKSGDILNGDLVYDNEFKGLILRDRDYPSQYYRIFVRNGSLGMEKV